MQLGVQGSDAEMAGESESTTRCRLRRKAQAFWAARELMGRAMSAGSGRERAHAHAADRVGDFEES